MACVTCGHDKCSCVKVISKQGRRGPRGPAGKASPNLTVEDANGGSVSNVTQVIFTNDNATVSSGGAGIAEVNFGGGAATVWNDFLNLPWYISGSESFKPQYTIEGNKITFRGLLYLPLFSSGSVNVSNTNSYRFIAGATLDDSRLSVITNANTNNGTPQGRFLTTNVSTSKNLPLAATPVSRDIVFNDVPGYRRHSGTFVTVYRTLVTIRIGSLSTIWANVPTGLGTGCIMVFSPFQDEYDGSGLTPLGNDPFGLQISRATSGVNAVDYIGATDNAPFSVPAAVGTNPFACNAHNITDLGGFIINLEGLSGYLN